MKKIFAVAVNEYRQVVFTYSFLISLLLPLAIYGGMFAFGYFFGDRTDLRDRPIVVIDRTEKLFDGIVAANRERDRSSEVMRNNRQVGPRWIIQSYPGTSLPDNRDLLIELSDQVRTGELFAFAIIGPDTLDPAGSDQNYLRYFSDSPTFDRLPNWLERTVRNLVEEHRFEQAGINRREINILLSHSAIERFNLAMVDADGNIVDPREDNRLAVFVLPLGLLFLIFMSIQMTSPILLNSVIEEKMQRIAEVLLACVSPFQLLTGKLLAGVGVGLTFSATYLISLVLTLRYFEKMEWIQPGIFLYFFIFLILGMLTFGSLYAGFSSACQDLKDSQNFIGPLIMLLVIPLLLAMVAIESPDGPLSVAISLIPPFSVLGMMLRVAIPPGPPDWQIWLSIFLNCAFAFFAIWLSARIFRIGILAQGKTPTVRELLRWVLQRN